MKKLLKILSDFFKSEPSPMYISPKPKSPTRIYVKDVKPGETIQVEWSRAQNGVCNMKCLSNDPLTKKILLEIRWSNYSEVKGVSEYEKAIFDYDGIELKNFHLLNVYKQQPQNSQDEGNDYDIVTLQKQMNDALTKEDYETAEKLQKKIDKLLKK